MLLRIWSKAINIFAKIGILRSLLVVFTLIIIMALPFADVSAEPVGLGLIKSAVLPAAAPMLFMVLMLDLLMCQIFKADATQHEILKLRFVGRVYMILGAILLLLWVPIFLSTTI